jgi:hypothetical protein
MSRLNIATCVILLLTIWNAVALVLLRPERGATGAVGPAGDNVTEQQVMTAVRAVLQDGARLHRDAVAELSARIVEDQRFPGCLRAALEESGLLGRAVGDGLLRSKGLVEAATAKAFEAPENLDRLVTRLLDDARMQQRVVRALSDSRAFADLVATPLEPKATAAATSVARELVDAQCKELTTVAEASARKAMEARDYRADVATALERDDWQNLRSAVRAALSPELIAPAITPSQLTAALASSPLLSDMVKSEISSAGGEKVSGALTKLESVLAGLSEIWTKYNAACEANLEDNKAMRNEINDAFEKWRKAVAAAEKREQRGGGDER